MPTYEYRCKDCGALTSIFTRSTSFDQAVKCEQCGSANTSRAISMFAFPRASEASDAMGSDFGLGDMGGMGGMGGMGMGGGHGHSHGGGFGGDLDMGDDDF